MADAFVTGGTGFVGRQLVRTLVSRGQVVRALARSEAAEHSLRAAGAAVVRGDITDQEALEGALPGAATVYHVAALVKDWGTRKEFYQANVEGTEVVLRAARAAGVPRLVHVSTEAVLLGGERPIVRAREDHPRPRSPLGLYPWSKALAEQRVLEANAPGFATVVVRPRFVWGQGDTSLLPKLIEAVRSGAFRWIDGGRHLTSTCHVRNLCEGMIRAAAAGRGGEIYFLTDGPPVEVRAFITALLRTQGVEIPDRSIPRWAAAAGALSVEGVWKLLGLRRPPPITRTAVKLIGEEVTVDDSKARQEIGYRNVVTREQGLAEMSEVAAAAGRRDEPGTVRTAAQ